MSIAISERYLFPTNNLPKIEQKSPGHCWDKIMVDKPSLFHTWINASPSYLLSTASHCVCVGGAQDHSQAQRFARRRDRTQKSCYTHDTVYYTKGMQLEIRKSHMGEVQKKQGTSFQVCPPGGVGQDTLNIL